jgi:hypothetical protein
MRLSARGERRPSAARAGRPAALRKREAVVAVAFAEEIGEALEVEGDLGDDGG